MNRGIRRDRRRITRTNRRIRRTPGRRIRRTPGRRIRRTPRTQTPSGSVGARRRSTR